MPHHLITAAVVVGIALVAVAGWLVFDREAVVNFAQGMAIIAGVMILPAVLGGLLIGLAHVWIRLLSPR